MEVLMDLRNLLAQGYVPVMGRDGRTVYLVQAARTVRAESRSTSSLPLVAIQVCPPSNESFRNTNDHRAFFRLKLASLYALQTKKHRLLSVKL